MLFRFVRYGKVRAAMPHVFVGEADGVVALHLPVGARGKWADWNDATPIRGQAERDWRLRDHVWHSRRVLRLPRRHAAHSLDLHWDGATDAFAGWYVNLQEPLRAAPLGFDTDDLVLDIWIKADGSWQWKDDDELAEAVRFGRFTPSQAAEIRAEGRRVLAERPWPTGWESWRPDPAWAMPVLPPNWDAV